MQILKPKTWACRCRKCDHRKRLRKHPDAYLRPKRCESCRKGTYRVDAYRDDGREARGKTCRPDRTGCQGYSFPHRCGSKFCDNNPNLTTSMSQERYESGHWH